MGDIVLKKHSQFMRSHLLPFLRFPVKNQNLTSIELNLRKEYDGTNSLAPELELLSNLPESLMFLKVNMQSRRKRLNSSAKPFVAALCKLLANKREHQIQTIALEH